MKNLKKELKEVATDNVVQQAELMVDDWIN